jgi:hypothetical protein
MQQVDRRGCETTALCHVPSPSATCAAPVPCLHHDHPHDGKGRRTLLWGISGGTLLSVLGFVAMFLYQEYSESLTELRRDLKHFNQTSAEYVRKDELQGRTTALWTRLRELKAGNAEGVKDLHALALANGARDTKVAELERQLKVLEEERREMGRELQRLRERLARVEGHQAATAVMPASHAEKDR